MRWSRGLLAVSLTLNLLAAAVAGLWVREHGWHDIGIKLHLTSDPRPDYAALAAQRFGGFPSTGIVVAGDSQVQDAPFADLVADFHQRGIGGQAVADVASWLPGSLTAGTRVVVVEAGTNDVLQGHNVAGTVADYRTMLDEIHQATDGRVVMLSVPPLTGYRVQVGRLNTALARLARQEQARWVDITSPIARDGRYAPGMTIDGTHLSRAGYERVAPLIRQAVR